MSNGSPTIIDTDLPTQARVKQLITANGPYESLNSTDPPPYTGTGTGYGSKRDLTYGAIQPLIWTAGATAWAPNGNASPASLETPSHRRLPISAYHLAGLRGDGTDETARLQYLFTQDTGGRPVQIHTPETEYTFAGRVELTQPNAKILGPGVKNGRHLRGTIWNGSSVSLDAVGIQIEDLEVIYTGPRTGGTLGFVYKGIQDIATNFGFIVTKDGCILKNIGAQGFTGGVWARPYDVNDTQTGKYGDQYLSDVQIIGLLTTNVDFGVLFNATRRTTIRQVRQMMTVMGDYNAPPHTIYSSYHERTVNSVTQRYYNYDVTISDIAAFGNLFAHTLSLKAVRGGTVNGVHASGEYGIAVLIDSQDVLMRNVHAYNDKSGYDGLTSTYSVIVDSTCSGIDAEIELHRGTELGQTLSLQGTDNKIKMNVRSSYTTENTTRQAVIGYAQRVDLSYSEVNSGTARGGGRVGIAPNATDVTVRLGRMVNAYQGVTVDYPVTGLNIYYDAQLVDTKPGIPIIDKFSTNATGGKIVITAPVSTVPILNDWPSRYSARYNFRAPGTGILVRDIGGNGYDLTLTNDLAAPADAAFSSAGLVFTSASGSNATGQRAQVGTPVDVTGDFSIALIATINNTAMIGTLLSISGSSTADYVDVRSNNTGGGLPAILAAFRGNGGSNTDEGVTGSFAATQTTVGLLVVRSGSVLTLYNLATGIAATTLDLTNRTFTPGAASKLTIGALLRGASSYSQYINATLRPGTLYPFALSADQVAATATWAKAAFSL
jgi:hypothetical protein